MPMMGRWVMSINRPGRSTSYFIRSMRLVPPAMNFAVGSLLIAAMASAIFSARTKEKLIIAAHSDQCFPVSARSRRQCSIGSAAAQVSAHQLSYFISCVRTVPIDQSERRTDLARRTVAALEGVVLYKGLLKGVQRTIARNPFDRYNA